MKFIDRVKARILSGPVVDFPMFEDVQADGYDEVFFGEGDDPHEALNNAFRSAASSGKLMAAIETVNAIHGDIEKNACRAVEPEEACHCMLFVTIRQR